MRRHYRTFAEIASEEAPEFDESWRPSASPLMQDRQWVRQIGPECYAISHSRRRYYTDDSPYCVTLWLRDANLCGYTSIACIDTIKTEEQIEHAKRYLARYAVRHCLKRIL